MARRTSGAVIGALSPIVAVIAIVVGTRPVENFWGQDCGTVFAPASGPSVGGVLERSMFTTSCPDFMGPLVLLVWVLGIAAAVLLVVAAVLLTKPSSSPVQPAWADPGRREPDASTGLGDQMAKLQTLKEQGALTEDEFSAAKVKLLNGDSSHSNGGQR
jgi:Flp pilus assembly protein TadB